MTEAHVPSRQTSRPSVSGSLTSRASVSPEQESTEPSRAQAVFVSDVYVLFEGRNNNHKSLTLLFYSLLHFQIRHENEIGAMAWDSRVKARFMNLFSRGDATAGETKPGDEEASTAGKAVQYRLAATRRTTKKTMWGRITSCCGLIGSSRANAGLAVGINPNQKLALYLHWMFRVNFVFLFGVMCIMFFALVILFSAFITIAGQFDPQCVRIGGQEFDSQNTAFADAFTLSWTTFSTVGYGSSVSLYLVCFVFALHVHLQFLLCHTFFTHFHSIVLFHQSLPPWDIRMIARQTASSSTLFAPWNHSLAFCTRDFAVRFSLERCCVSKVTRRLSLVILL
jgi:hypothetical protein